MQNRRFQLFAIVAVIIVILAVFVSSRGSSSYSGWSNVEGKLEDCEEDECVLIGTIEPQHGGTMFVVHHPTLEDGITEWSTCLDELIACADADEIASCATSSGCPGECLELLEMPAGQPMEASVYLESLMSVFVAEGGYCEIPKK